MIRLRYVWLLSCFVSSVAWAAPVPPAATPTMAPPTRVDPAARTALTWLRTRGALPPWFAEAARSPTDARVPLAVRTREGAPRTSKHIALERSAPLASGAYLVRVDAAGLRELETDARVTHLELVAARLGTRPLQRAQVETAVEAARRTVLLRDGKVLDGSGVRVADLDSPLHTYHPALFRADAGAYAWIDVDGDGAFDPAHDAVELDGEAAPLRLLPLRALGRQETSLIEASTTLRPDLDYLYVDTNDNGERDVGRAFGEQTPAYGEPLFVADDANGNGVLDVGEKLLRLGTSKVLKVKNGDTVYERGAERNALVRWVGDKEDAAHATAVAGLLAGGVWGTSKFLGLAPGVDVLSVVTSSNLLLDIQWSLDEGAHVLLTEYAPYVGFPLDGSTEEEQLLDSAVANGAVVVSPAGNLFGTGKTLETTLEPGVTTVTVKTNTVSTRLLGLTLLDRASAPSLDVALKLPESEDFVPLDELTTVGGYQIAREISRTSRGTNMVNIYLTRADNGQIPKGSYELQLTNRSAEAILVRGFVYDYVNSWSGGATFTEHTGGASVCHPATAERTLSVAAYTLHAGADYGAATNEGELTRGSSRGTLLDGRVGIDIAAPANPLSLMPAPDQSHQAVWFRPFGGTSGAGALVAAAAALLRQADPSASAETLRQRIVEGATAAGEPSAWGAGKLNLVGALGVEAPTLGEPPTDVRVEAPRDGVVVGRDNRLEVRADGLGDGARTRWDFDYDGTPDTEWIEGTAATFTPTKVGEHFVRVWVVGADGQISGAASSILVQDTPSVSEDDPTDGCSVGGATREPPSMMLVIAVSVLALGWSRPRVRAA